MPLLYGLVAGPATLVIIVLMLRLAIVNGRDGKLKTPMARSILVILIGWLVLHIIWIDLPSLLFTKTAWMSLFAGH